MSICSASVSCLSVVSVEMFNFGEFCVLEVFNMFCFEVGDGDLLLAVAEFGSVDSGLLSFSPTIVFFLYTYLVTQ